MGASLSVGGWYRGRVPRGCEVVAAETRPGVAPQVRSNPPKMPTSVSVGGLRFQVSGLRLFGTYRTLGDWDGALD